MLICSVAKNLPVLELLTHFIKSSTVAYKRVAYKKNLAYYFFLMTKDKLLKVAFPKENTLLCKWLSSQFLHCWHKIGVGYQCLVDDQVFILCTALLAFTGLTLRKYSLSNRKVSSPQHLTLNNMVWLSLALFCWITKYHLFNILKSLVEFCFKEWFFLSRNCCYPSVLKRMIYSITSNTSWYFNGG